MAVASGSTAELADTITAPPVQGTAGSQVQQEPPTIAELNAPDGNTPVEINTVYKATLPSQDYILTHHHRMIASIMIPRLGPTTADRIQHH